MARKRDDKQKQKQQQALLDELASIKELLDDDSDNAGQAYEDLDTDLIQDDPDEDLEIDEFNLEASIPVLQEVIDDDEPASPEQDATVESPGKAAPLADQPSLFSQPKAREQGTQTSAKPITQERPKAAQSPAKQAPAKQSSAKQSPAKHSSPKQSSPKQPSPEQPSLTQPSPTQASTTKNSPLGENPFLPEHIRKRLNVEAENAAYSDPQSGINPLNLPIVQGTQYVPGSPQDKNDSDKIIDSLVKEFLPKI
ncbi:MAG: hypothetical protein AAFZ92_06220, partial [Pseudomonadota bacterium]